MNSTRSYLLEVPGLSDAIASCPVDAKYLKLIDRIGQFDELSNIKLVKVRGGAWLTRSKVLDDRGDVVGEDHESWITDQVAADGGQASITYERLKDKGYLLTKREITTLYLVHDRGTSDESNFLQVEVELHEQRADRFLFSDWPYKAPRSARDLIEMPGHELPDEKRTRIGSPAFQLRRATDVRRFVEEATALAMQEREEFRQRRYVIEAQPGVSVITRQTPGADVGRTVTADEAFPEWDKFPVKWGRMFTDWAASSAARSGARLCEHWAMQLSDYTSPQGKRDMSLIPVWATSLKLAKVEGHRGSEYELLGKLEKLDNRVKVPFAWYFFMLHGNRVDDHAARRVLAAAEDGHIVLPEHDYRVLKSWERHPYGF